MVKLYFTFQLFHFRDEILIVGIVYFVIAFVIRAHSLVFWLLDLVYHL